MVSLAAAALAAVPLALGALAYRYAYAIARVAEQLDAIGSTTELSGVEPAAWNVMIGKGVAVMLVLLGLLLLFGALLA